ncbi:MAG: hypothetical protein JWP76_4233 [Dactylosporangium sp.]|jgi:hypothetical protein|nr:hypothetical protein [Dactylosporangium sp.]
MAHNLHKSRLEENKPLAVEVPPLAEDKRAMLARLRRAIQEGATGPPRHDGVSIGR